MHSRFPALAAVLLLALPLASPAQNLTQVYRDAKENDPAYAAARYALSAGMEKLPQGRALVLPTVSLSASASSTRIDTEARASPPPFDPFIRDARGHGYTLSLSQPIYRAQNFIQWDQAEFQVRQAEAVFGQAAQELMLRVAQFYFEYLGAQDSLTLVRAQKTAIAEQLAQAKRNFEVGTATITDTHEAQARFDISASQEIAAMNDLENRRHALQGLTGKLYPTVKGVRSDVRLTAPNPPNMQAWVDIAMKQNWTALAQEAVTEIANLEVKRNSAAHHPTLDFVASYGYNSQTASSASPFGSNTNTGTFGLQLALPIYSGGSISSRVREAAANYERSKQELETVRRNVAFVTRQAYLAVISGVAGVASLEQAVLSSQSALDSNKLGYEVGVRINIDVLNAQQQLFAARRELALARYNTITAHFRLKAAAGALKEEDLETASQALEP
jgi:outer membrane protein